MTSSTTTTLERLAADILDSACPNGGTVDNGWNTYIIETHCVEWRITARKLDGQWAISNIVTQPC